MRVQLPSLTPNVNTIMKLNELHSKQIILVCGNLCSGKGHYCQQYFPDAEVITVSSIVKKLSKFTTRSELATTKSLDTKISAELINQIAESSNNQVVVDGIRQMSIVNSLKLFFKDQIKDVIWLDVPEQTLKSRFEQRNAGKDDISFEKALQSDKELGVGEVENYIRQNHRVIPY